MLLELAVVTQLAARCAPQVAVETIASVMQMESGFQLFAIGVNGPGGGPIMPATQEAAVAIASDLIVRQRRSVDLGLMQINSRNLPALGLTIADAFDPCRNIAAGAVLLQEGYTAARRTEDDPQRALSVALSRYNTGNAERGFANGYVTRVRDAAEVVVPAIRLRADIGSAPGEPPRQSLASAPAIEDPDAPPAWDVWARAAYIGRPRPTPTATPESGPAASLQERIPE
jgi:type IV secretion system protein VirB1